jgi:adenosylcobinamide-phosphate synthase
MPTVILDIPIPDPPFILLMALILDALFGDPPLLFRFLPHPVRAIGAMIGFLDRKLNRPGRLEADRLTRGLLTVSLMAALSWWVGLLVLDAKASVKFGWLLELFLAWTLIAQRGLFDAVRAVRLGLKKSGVEGGRAAVSQIVGRDVTRLDEHGVSRAAIESLAENFSDAVVAPVFWYLILGFPGLLLYKTINTMDSMLGHKTPRLRAFGFTAAKLDDLVNLIPARLSGLILVLASFFVPTASPWQSVKVMLRDSHKHRSPNAGWPEGAAAGALKLALSGPRVYAEGPTSEPWIGGEFSARSDHRDIKRALYLFVTACLLNAMIVSGVWALYWR